MPATHPEDRRQFLLYDGRVRAQSWVPSCFPQLVTLIAARPMSLLTHCYSAGLTPFRHLQWRRCFFDTCGRASSWHRLHLGRLACAGACGWLHCAAVANCPFCFTDVGDCKSSKYSGPPKMQGSSALGGGPFLRCHCGTIGHSPGLSTSISVLKGCLHAQVLCFEACWDDSAQEFGDVRRFRVHYFLGDGTLEVRHRVPQTDSHCCR